MVVSNVQMTRIACIALALAFVAQQPQPAPDAAARAETAHIVKAASAWTAGFEQGLSGLVVSTGEIVK